MKKFTTFLLGSALALSANAITADDLAGVYELKYPYGSLYYVDSDGRTTFGYAENDSDTQANKALIDEIVVTVDGNTINFSNFLNLSFSGVIDLEAKTVTLPPQDVNSPTGYTWLQCLMESSMWAENDSTPATFDEEKALPIVLSITDDGDLTLYHEGETKEDSYWNYIAYWGWGANYGFITGVFHKTADLTVDEDTAPILGTYTCKDFSGQWCWLWTMNEEDEEWHDFDIATGLLDSIYFATKGDFKVEISSMTQNKVKVSGLWWGYLEVTGAYDAATKTITFPVQDVWGGYTFCNSSFEADVVTEADVVPATAVFNEDGSLSFNYTVEYGLWAYLWGIKQTITPDASGIQNAVSEAVNVPAEYYNLQGIRVNENDAHNGLFIVRQGNKVTKRIIK